MNSKLHAATDGEGRPVALLLTGGQASDYHGAALMFNALPQGQRAHCRHKEYDGDWFRQALAAPGIAARIPSKSNRRLPIPHDPVLYRQRHESEIMFCRLKDWRRVHTRYDRCAHTFFAAICIAATVTFWRPQ